MIKQTSTRHFFNLFFLFIGVIITGCNSVQVSYPEKYRDNTKQSGSTKSYTPPINTIATRNVGQSLIKQNIIYEYNTYDVLPIDNKCSKLLEMEPVLYKWTSNQWNMMCRYDKKECLVDVTGENEFNFKTDELDDLSALEPLSCKVKYKIIPTPSRVSEMYFKYELIYQARVGNKLKLSYMEYANDHARPAFTQVIEYDLDQKGDIIIGFKNLRMQILNATNNEITYKILKYGDE